MSWSAILWIVIGIAAVFIMMRCCGGMMGGMRSRGCGMPGRDGKNGKGQKDSEKTGSDKAA